MPTSSNNIFRLYIYQSLKFSSPQKFSITGLNNKKKIFKNLCKSERFSTMLLYETKSCHNPSQLSPPWLIVTRDRAHKSLCAYMCMHLSLHVCIDGGEMWKETERVAYRTAHVCHGILGSLFACGQRADCKSPHNMRTELHRDTHCL